MSVEWSKEDKDWLANWLHRSRKRQLKKKKEKPKEKRETTPFFFPTVDRRGSVTMKRRAQTGVVRPPTDESPDNINNDYDYQEILDVGDDLVNAYHELELPPQSMSLFLPLGKTHDDAVRTDPNDADWVETMEQYFRALGKVVQYLAEQGYEMDAHWALLHEYVNHFYSHPEDIYTAASQNRKLLAFAAKLQGRGSTEVARSVMRIIKAQHPEEYEDEYDEDEDTAELGHSPIWDDPVEYYKFLLATEAYDEAREYYQSRPPHERDEMDRAAKKVFALTNITKLHRFGMKLLRQGNQEKAFRVRRAVDDLLQALPFEDQQQIVVLLVPDGVDLPQAFKAQQEKSQEAIDNKMTDMMNRLQPNCPAEIVHRILKLADKLDEQGKTKIANQLDRWLKTANTMRDWALEKRFEEEPPVPEEMTDDPHMEPEAKRRIGLKPQTKVTLKEQEEEAKADTEERYHRGTFSSNSLVRQRQAQKKKDTGVAQCQGCGADIYYDKTQGPDKFCRHCKKDPWKAQASLKQAQQEGEKKKKETGVTTCAGCGADIYYDKTKGSEKYCYQCKKDMWGTQASLKKKLVRSTKQILK